MTDTLPLFDLGSAAPGPRIPGLSADRRRTQRQAAHLACGLHPLTAALGYPIRLHPDAAPADDRAAPGRRCGNCWYRHVLDHHDRTYPKCVYTRQDARDFARQPERITHGAGTDVRAWWPACRDHTYGDPALSPDAARYVPEVTDQ